MPSSMNVEDGAAREPRGKQTPGSTQHMTARPPAPSCHLALNTVRVRDRDLGEVLLRQNDFRPPDESFWRREGRGLI